MLNRGGPSDAPNTFTTKPLPCGGAAYEVEA